MCVDVALLRCTEISAAVRRLPPRVAPLPLVSGVYWEFKRKPGGCGGGARCWGQRIWRVAWQRESGMRPGLCWERLWLCGAAGAGGPPAAGSARPLRRALPGGGGSLYS